MKLIKFLFCLTLLSCSVSPINAQVGIDTDEPTATLDINGDLRIRQTDISTSTNDYNLVIDSTGLLKRSLISNSLFRGYLSTDFTTGSEASQIYKVDNFTVIDDPSGDFDTTNSSFTPSVTGLYNIVMTITVTQTETISSSNIVAGLVSDSNQKWVMRFSIPKGYIEAMGNNSTSGVTNSFSGAVMLTKDEKYNFGITSPTKILSYPTGNTGEGIGTYFSIELIKTY